MLRFVSIISLLPFSIFSAPDNHGEGSPELQIIAATKEEVEAEYSTLTGGILIVSQMSQKGEAIRVSIKSTNGEMIFEVDCPFGDLQSYLSIAGEEFLVVNKTTSDGNVKLTIYHMPASDSYQAKSMKYYGYVRKPMLR